MIQINPIDGGLQRDIGGWGDRTFGLSNHASLLAHLSDEIDEVGEALFTLIHEGERTSLSRHPEALAEYAEELADCVMLLSHYAHKGHFVLEAPIYQLEPWMSKSAVGSYDSLASLFPILARTHEKAIARYMLVMLHLMAQAYGLNLKEELEKKFEKNKNRQWGKPDERGVVRHIS